MTTRKLLLGIVAAALLAISPAAAKVAVCTATNNELKAAHELDENLVVCFPDGGTVTAAAEFVIEPKRNDTFIETGWGCDLMQNAKGELYCANEKETK
jgi:hypothetical protein